MGFLYRGFFEGGEQKGAEFQYEGGEVCSMFFFLFLRDYLGQNENRCQIRDLGLGGSFGGVEKVKFLGFCVLFGGDIYCFEEVCQFFVFFLMDCICSRVALVEIKDNFLIRICVRFQNLVIKVDYFSRIQIFGWERSCGVFVNLVGVLGGVCYQGDIFLKFGLKIFY